jgi:hypothetical protein
MHHNQGAVLTETILRCGVQKHPRHIQQGVGVAVAADTGCRLAGFAGRLG